MAYSGSPQTKDRKKSPATAGIVPKMEPRVERLRIPRKNIASQRHAAVFPTVSRLPSGSSNDILTSPASPRVYGSQAFSGAADERGTYRPWQDNSSPDTPSKQCQSKESTVREHSPRDRSSPHGLPPPQSSGAHVEGTATATFDFGLSTSKPKVPSTLRLIEESRTPAQVRTPATVRTPSKDKALPLVPSPHTPTFSLFPTPTTRPNMDVTSRHPVHHKSSYSASPRVPLPMGISIDPTRPRKASLPSSLRSRADSCMSPHLLPSATIVPRKSMSSSSKKLPRRPLPIRVSSNMPTSPPPAQSPTSIRWSGDTVTRSFDSSDGGGRERSSTSSSAPSPSPWPESGSFFEIDDDEEVPLRRKVATKIRGARAWSSSTVDSDATIVAAKARRERSFLQRWLLCCSSSR